jgi:hypothetical protein
MFFFDPLTSVALSGTLALGVSQWIVAKRQEKRQDLIIKSLSGIA